FVAGVLVRMVLEREFAIGLFDLLVAGVPAYTEHLVIIALGHGELAGHPVQAAGLRATTTCAGRISRSLILYPFRSCWTTCPSGTSAVSCWETASCQLGSNGLFNASISSRPLSASAALN